MELRCSSSGSVTVRQAGSEAASGVHRPGSDAWSGSRVRSQQSSMLEQKFLPNQMLLATGHRPGSGLLFVKHQWGGELHLAGEMRAATLQFCLWARIELLLPALSPSQGPLFSHLVTERTKL